MTVVEKEQYYTESTISQQANEYMSELQEFRVRHPYNYLSRQVALIVIDMQEFFLDPASHAYVPSANAILKPIKKLQDTFLAHNMPVIQTRHTNNEDNAGSMLTWWGSLLRDEDPLAQITPCLTNTEIPVLNKTQQDAFYQTELQKVLTQQGIKQLVICGVMTHLCCESTTRAAFTRGFNNLFVVDSTATYNSKFQRATLLNLAHGYAVPVLSNEIIESMEKANNV